MSEGAEGPLAGLLVVSIEQAVAAPFATSRLADAGARIIKIERTEGDFARAYDRVVGGECAWFVWLNRGKESVVLDIKNADDNALLRRIVERRPISSCRTWRRAQRHGRASTRARSESAIPASSPATSAAMARAALMPQMKAYDFLIQCESGIASVTGSPESASRVGVSVCDIGAGLNAYGAILEALHARHRTGQGSGIRVSLFDGMADWMTVPLLHLEHGGKAPARTGLSHAMIAPYGAYPVGDGGQMVIAIQNEREWARFCEQESWAMRPSRRTHASPATRPGYRTGPRWTRSSSQPSARHDMESLAADLTRRGNRLRPPQRGRRPIRAPAASPRRRCNARRHGRNRRTPRPPRRRRPPPPPRPCARRAERGDPGGVFWRRLRPVSRPLIRLAFKDYAV